jgi:hypothetical protein
MAPGYAKRLQDVLDSWIAAFSYSPRRFFIMQPDHCDAYVCRFESLLGSAEVDGLLLAHEGYCKSHDS